MAGRKPILIDRDNFEDVLADLQPELKLGRMVLSFRDLDDFHPDQIYRKQDEFEDFVETRKRPAVGPKPAPPPDPGRSLLDQMLDFQAPPEPAPMEANGDLAEFIKRSMAPHLVHEDPQQKARIEAADSAAASAMREVLHNREFQELEAAWRAVWMLVRGLETGETLKVYLFDVTLAELIADLDGTVKLLTTARTPWSAIAANFYFGQSSTDAKVLSMMGRIAEHARAPFLAGAALEEDASPDWQALRHAPESHWIGLTLPRFLLRLPYGKKTSPVESFEFEEMPESDHAAYLWGNPAFACAYLLGKTFLHEGWDMRPGAIRQIGDLPLHVYQEDGEPTAKPCAETLMTEKQSGLLMEQGFMPLASLKGTDSILLVRFQSISDPAAALGGRWQR